MLNWRSSGKPRSRPGPTILSSIWPLGRSRQQTMTFGTMKVANLMRPRPRNLRISFERLKLLSSFLFRVQVLDSDRRRNTTRGLPRLPRLPRLEPFGGDCCTYNYLITQSSEIKLTLLNNEFTRNLSFAIPLTGGWKSPMPSLVSTALAQFDPKVRENFGVASRLTSHQDVCT